MIGIDVVKLADTISRLGFAGLLIFILAGFQQGWWFFGRERVELAAALVAMEKDRDEWKAIALQSLRVGERAVGASAAVLPPPSIVQ